MVSPETDPNLKPRPSNSKWYPVKKKLNSKQYLVKTQYNQVKNQNMSKSKIKIIPCKNHSKPSQKPNRNKVAYKYQMDRNKDEIRTTSQPGPFAINTELSQASKQ